MIQREERDSPSINFHPSPYIQRDDVIKATPLFGEQSGVGPKHRILLSLNPENQDVYG
jgi:hypothetical protein